MKLQIRVVSLLLAALFCLSAHAAPEPREFVYKNASDRDLKVIVHYPGNWKASDQRPVMVFFFGGGWKGGSTDQFLPQADYFAARGLVTVRVDYRIKNTDGVLPDACVEDARSAVRWVRGHAAELGVDPEKLIASGGSAGGHLAACTAIPHSVEADEDDLTISTVPMAMVLYNPVLDFRYEALLERLGDKQDLAEKISPIAYLDKNSPPSIVFYGSEDKLKAQGDAYRAKAKELGVRADEFVGEGMGHGFFNRPPWLDPTTQAADRFLMSLGLLDAGMAENLDLVYAAPDGIEQLLDLRRPAGAEGPLPLIVWVHGGGWRNGSKGNANRVLPLVERGYAAASIDYRLTDAAQWPAQIQDCKAAIRWLRAHAKEYNLDPDRIGAWGSSAGGHLVAMLGAAGGVKAFDTGDNLKFSSDVQAVCDWFGPTDFLRMNDMPGAFDHEAADAPESLLLGGPVREHLEAAKSASPLTYVDGNEPPFLIMQGDKDALVIYPQSEYLQAALEKAGIESTLYIDKNGGHGFKGATDDTQEELVEMAAAFFDRVFKHTPAQMKLRPSKAPRKRAAN